MLLMPTPTMTPGLLARMQLDLGWSIGGVVLAAACILVAIRGRRERVSGLVAAAVVLNFLALLGWTFQGWSIYAESPTRVATFGGCVVLPLTVLSVVAAFLTFLTLAERPNQGPGTPAPPPRRDPGSGAP